MASRKRKAPPPPVPPVAADVRREFVTFRPVGSYEIRSLEQREPSCFNGEVRIRQFCVTVELVDEPIEAIHARIIDLWERSDNHHHMGPLRIEAKRYGLDLTPYTWGGKRVCRG